MYRKSAILRWKKYMQQFSWYTPFFIGIVAAVSYALWTQAPVFPDPDSFYHIKIAQLMLRRQEPITEFPWLQFTVLRENYVDHHFLYHVFLIPFIKFAGPLWGMKIATIVLATAVIVLFYTLLRSLSVRLPVFFTLILLFNNSFSFRMGLAKAPSVGFLFLMTGFWCMMKQRWKELGVLAFFYVWAYGGFFLLCVLAVVYSLVQFFEYSIRNGRFPKQKDVLVMITPTVVVVFGIVAGLLIHPSFPHHFQIYWQQIIQIGLVNYHSIIGVGQEWYPMSVSNLIASPILATFVFFVGIIMVCMTRRFVSVMTMTTFVMASIFIMFTLKSQRYIEYEVPWIIMAGAFAVSSSAAQECWQKLIRLLRFLTLKDWAIRIIVSVFVVYGITIIPTIMISEAFRLKRSLHDGIPINTFAGSGSWLRQHSVPGDIIFHDDWDNFPILFFQTAKPYYIVGLDPTFMFNDNQERYWEWVRITTGETHERLLESIRDDFRARFVFVESDHRAMRDTIEDDGRFIKVYTDDEATIYEVPAKK